MKTTTSAALAVLAYLAFISLGLPDALLGVAWPSVSASFGISPDLLGIPLAITAAAYFLSGLFAGRLIERLGIGLLLASSTALVVAAQFGFSLSPAFWIFLVAAPIAGFGSGAIDAALNTWAAKNFSARHMSWLHAAYAAGATTGPIIMTAAITRGPSWRLGYGIVGGLLTALTLAFVATRRRWEARSEEVVLDAPGNVGPLQPEPSLFSGFTHLRNPRVRLQIGIFFFYSGLEISAGQWCFTILTESRGLSDVAGGAWAAAFWGGMLAGRVVLGMYVERIGQVRLLRLATLGAVVSATLFAIPSALTAFALPLLAFSLASIYPGLMAETPRRIGEQAAVHVVGFQVSAATLGIAALPSFAGLLSAWISL